MIRSQSINTIRSWILGLAVFATWFVPSPGILGVRTSLGLLVITLIAGRFSRHIQSHIFFLITAGLIAVPPAWLPVWVRNTVQVAAVTSILPPAFAIRGVIWFLLSVFIVVGPGWGWGAVMVAAIYALLRNDCYPPVSIIRFGVLCSLIAAILSVVLVTYPRIPIHGSEYDAKWRIAGILNRRNPMVRLKSVYDALHTPGKSHDEMDYLAILDGVEGRLGSSAEITTIRIAALDMTGRIEEARAHLVESIRFHQTIPTRIFDLFPGCAPWIRAASYLHTGYPDSRTALLGFKPDDFEDSISAEYAARTLLACGLSDMACSLSIAAGYRDSDWLRYVVWRSHMPWHTKFLERMISDTTLSVPTDSLVLLHGEPARGTWPEYHMRCGDVQLTEHIESEFPVAVSFGGSLCTLRFLNDLRSYKDDRNLIYSGMIGADRTYSYNIDVTVETLWNRITTRVRGWNLTVTDSFDILDTGITGDMERLSFFDTSGIVTDTIGYMMKSDGYLLWNHLPVGEYAAIMRAEPAQGRWPVIEHRTGERVRHVIVDSWSWKPVSLNHVASDSVFILKFCDDYWNEETGEDRNVWFAGLVRK